MKIKLLSNKTINKISAGEVIERPASAVKELVENAIDAGAKKIIIRLERAGKNLISISDDGYGMDAENLQMAIQRHATSKLDEEDLLNINSFGFRGEALPSIGAIAKLKITTAVGDNDQAHMIEITGGEVSDIKIASRTRGTTVEVRDLFFATPARLKFLRTDRTELNAIMGVIKRITLGYPAVEFQLFHEGKQLLHVRPSGNSDDEILHRRIGDIVGKEFIENSTKVDFASDEIHIFGYTCLPTFNKATSEDQFLFINRRPVKDKILNIALKVAYQDFIARDRFPVTALFIEVPTKLVDVNVHPAKTEVRFYDPNSMRSMVIAAIKSALNETGHRVSTTTATQALKYMQRSADSSAVANDSFVSGNNRSGQSRFIVPSSRSSKDFGRADYALALNQGSTMQAYRAVDNALQQNPLEINAAQQFAPQGSEEYTQEQIAGISNTQPVANVVTNCEIENEQLALFPLGAAKAQLHETYIVSQTKDSIIFIDQHAAHERLGYEKIKKHIERDGLTKQRLLIPEIIEMEDNARAEILASNEAELSTLGLTIEKFGEKSIIVSEIPSIIGDTNIKKLVQDIAAHLLESGVNIALTEMIEHITETYACHYAIRAGRKLNSSEMNELLRQMEETAFSGQCNHGRPTYVELKLADIEKLFGRR